MSHLSPTPLVEELIPAPDPWDVARKLAHLPHLLFLDSADPNPVLGRYSYVAADPVDILIRAAPADSSEDIFWDDRFDCVRVTRPDIPELPPFIGGWAGLFGYHLGRAFERQPLPHRDDFHVPDLAVGVYDWVISFDRLTGRAWIVSTGIIPGDPVPNERAIRAEFRLGQVQEWLSQASGGCQPPGIPHYQGVDTPRSPPPIGFPLPGFPGIISNFDRPAYEAAVRRVLEYIRAGDCFQVNLSQRLLAPYSGSPLDLYGKLRECNPCAVRGLFRSRRICHRQRIAGAVSEAHIRQASRNAADQGHAAARPNTGRR